MTITLGLLETLVVVEVDVEVDGLAALLDEVEFDDFSFLSTLISILVVLPLLLLLSTLFLFWYNSSSDAWTLSITFEEGFPSIKGSKLPFHNSTP